MKFYLLCRAGGLRLIRIPDIIGKTSIGVYSADPAHSAGRRAVFRHVHVVSGSGEPRRLVCIQHGDSDGGPVLEGAATQEARIHYGVEHLHREGVGAPALVVYRLGRTTDTGELIGLEIFNVEVYNRSFRYALSVK